MIGNISKRLNRISSGTFIVAAVALAAVVVVAVFASDKSEEVVGFVKSKFLQPMEIRGQWLGMDVTGTDSNTARRLGIPSSVEGVLVVEIRETDGWRARQAGLMEADVVVAIDKKKIRDMSDLFNVTRNLDVGNVVILDVLRWGQALSLALPAVNVPVAPPVTAPNGVAPQPAAVAPGGVGFAPPAGVALGPTVPAAAQAAWVNPAGVPAAAWTPGAAGPPQFLCPRDNTVFSQGTVHPHYHCPRCWGPLNRVR